MQAPEELIASPPSEPHSDEVGAPAASAEHDGVGPLDACTPAPAAGGAREVVVGPVALSLAPAARRRHRVTARLLAGGQVVAVDTVELARAAQRERFVEQLLEKLDLPAAEAAPLADGLNAVLLQLASSAGEPGATGQPAGPLAEFRVVENAENPDLDGSTPSTRRPGSPTSTCGSASRSSSATRIARRSGLASPSAAAVACGISR
jgi:hypothetical protein